MLFLSLSLLHRARSRGSKPQPTVRSVNRPTGIASPHIADVGIRVFAGLYVEDSALAH